MGLRLATGVTGAAVVVGAVWLGSPWLTLLALLGGGLAIRETYRLTPSGVGRMPVLLGVVAVAALLLAAEAAAPSDFHLASGLVLAGWVLAALLWFIACYDVSGDQEVEEPEDDLEEEPETGYGSEDAPHNDVPSRNEYVRWTDPPGNLPVTSRPFAIEEDVEEGEEDWEYVGEDDKEAPAGRPWLGFLFLLAGPVYVGFFLGHGLALRDLAGETENFGRSWLLFTLLVVFASDTGAFAVGRLLGRHRMAPRLSPNKTWEGAAGGLLASIGAALLVGVVFDLALPDWHKALFGSVSIPGPAFYLSPVIMPVWQQALIGAAASVAAQIGDLAESALKRAANAKDSGSIMPGHGGILDRMDSILFALPAVFYLLLAAGFRL